MAVPLIAGIASAVIGGAQAIYGATQNAKAKREQQRLIDQQKAEYEKEKNTAYVDTPEAQGVLNAAKEQMEEQARRDEGVAAMTGQTHEAKLAARDRSNKAYANIVRQVASGANRYKENLRNWYRGILGSQMGLHEQQAASGSAMIGSGINTAMSGAQTLSGAFTPNTTTELDTSTSTGTTAAQASQVAGTGMYSQSFANKVLPLPKLN
jgi:hypothetical protein